VIALLFSIPPFEFHSFTILRLAAGAVRADTHKKRCTFAAIIKIFPILFSLLQL
jgi:hypothetical protein